MMPTQPGTAPPQPKKSNLGMILAVVGVSVVVLIGILGAIALFGVRKYIANAKTAEARNALAQIGRDAVTAYEESAVASGKRRLCPSASKPVPANESALVGKKYLSTPADWNVDSAANAGFACLKFEMSQPQYFQYSYTATPTGFTARARGDLNGNGVFSSFELQGQIVNGKLLVAPSLLETNPQE